MAGRFIFIVLDGVGAGALPDAPEYGDAGSDTLGNLSRAVSLRLPFLQCCGLGNIIPVQGVPPVREPLCLPGRLAERSAGKDTTVGHWEHMGLVSSSPFPTYPQGFPNEIITAFSERIGRGILGNVAASGTAIIAELGEEHLKTGRPIVYTSADSVFQIAAHADLVPLESLYSWCRTARDLLHGRHAVARVIARPFDGPAGAFVRTKDRRDFSLEPPGPTYLDLLEAAGVPVLALGKISEVFVGRGVSRSVKVGSNADNLALVADLLLGRSSRASFDEGLLMTNLVDFDMLWGHRNDVDGFAQGLEAVDAALPRIFAELRAEDRLVITADHGVDPTTVGTDHSREYVPLLLYPRPEGAPDAVYEGFFADTGAAVYEALSGRRARLAGSSVLRLRPERGWRRYTPVQSTPANPDDAVSVRLGPDEVAEAVEWLRANVGETPQAAVVLGSGLAPQPARSPMVEVPYHDIPYWRSGAVEGHPHLLSVVDWMGWRVALLKGRAHEYEGFDESEVQFAVRCLASWGVRHLVLTSASGAVEEGLLAGEVAAVDEVVEMQAPADGSGSGARPGRTSVATCECGVRRVVHASLPGPQYETPAELTLLRHLGVGTVSMSPGAELRAAHEEGMRVAVLTVVANAGDTTHEEVLRGVARAGAALSAAIEQQLKWWGAPAPLY